MAAPIDVTPSELEKVLEFQLRRNQIVLVTGASGTGKTTIAKDIVMKVLGRYGLRHPGNEDPTYQTGFPWCYQENGKASARLVEFDMNKIISEATEPVGIILDDFGQGTNAVQASWMPVLLDRLMTGREISEHVRFVILTNRREDRAGVSTVLLPVVSRCLGGTYNLVSSVKDWCLYAIRKGLPYELIQYVRLMDHRGDNRLLNTNPPREIVGYYCPRTVEAVGKAMLDGMPPELEYTIMAGICGVEWATEATAYFKIARKLPTKESIILNPTTAIVPDTFSTTGAAELFAVCGMLAKAADDSNFDSILAYAQRLPAEYTEMILTDAITGKPELAENPAYIKYAVKMSASNVGL